MVPHSRGEDFLYLLVVVIAVNFECYLGISRNMKMTEEVDFSEFC